MKQLLVISNKKARIFLLWLLYEPLKQKSKHNDLKNKTNHSQNNWLMDKINKQAVPAHKGKSGYLR